MLGNCKFICKSFGTSHGKRGWSQLLSSSNFRAGACCLITDEDGGYLEVVEVEAGAGF